MADLAYHAFQSQEFGHFVDGEIVQATRSKSDLEFYQAYNYILDDIIGMPQKANNVGAFEDSIRFIASGRTVISNSYHGVYWALLMGRKTICIPFSNKFSAYRMSPAYATPKNWLSKLDAGIAQPDMLYLCRSLTIKFKAKVDALLAVIDR